MNEIEIWIDEAAAATGIVVTRQQHDVAHSIVSRIREAFVKDNPRAWWLGLKLPFKQYLSDEVGLTEVLPGTVGTCWLIAETDSEELPVYEINASNVEDILKDCPYFEYYIAAKDLSWLVVESDHNVFYVCERERSFDKSEKLSS